jgi:hypothetical protein
MLKISLFALVILLSLDGFSQGCVAIRTTGGYCSAPEHTDHAKWLLSMNNRYFKSFRHYSGTEEQKQRVDEGTEVINHQYTMDLALTRIINSRWSFMIDVPVLSNTRSSLYEHKNVGRYTTRDFGVGDIRFAAYAWLFAPEKMYKGNVQIGAGLKLPTGNYNYQDYFQLTDSTRVLGPVDQSIQLGDGGTGMTLELNTFFNFSSRFSIYGNFFYLSNPREQNGVSTARGGTPSASAIANRSEVMSVPDQYMARTGVNVNLDHFTVSAGMRYESIPTYDLIGGSNGFRRPGRILTVEPGVNFHSGRTTVFLFVPYALYRERMQSVPDKLNTARTGRYTIGDAAFADYSVNVGAAIKF